MRRTSALIVGGGPAGAAAAIALAQAGAAPELIERYPAPRDMVCGGFLGWDALAALRRLGIEASELGARPISRMRLISGERTVEAPLPHRAAGLSRRTLDTALQARAEALGATLTRRTVRAADLSDRRLRLDDGEEIAAHVLFLATGKHELRGAERPLGARRDHTSAGLRASLPPSPERERMLAGAIELHLFDQAYAGLLLQEDGSANLCLSVSPHRLGAAGGPLPLLAELLEAAPVLAERIGADRPDKFAAVAGVPYGWRAGETHPGVFRIGDQGGVIASLAGDGIAIALTSGESAARAFLSGGAQVAQAWQRGFSTQSTRPIRTAEALRYSAEHRLPRDLLMGLLNLAPGLGSHAARLTRIAAG